MKQIVSSIKILGENSTNNAWKVLAAVSGV